MNKNKKRYTRQQLERLTTLQLRDICFDEKLIKGIANMLDREMFINTILNFRGANEDFLIRKYSEDGYDWVSQVLKPNLGNDVRPKEIIANPAKLTVYHSLAIEPRDGYKVLTKNERLAETNVLLVDENGDLCGIFNLLPNDDDKFSLYLCMGAGMEVSATSNKNYRLLYFEQDVSEYLFEIYSGEENKIETFSYYEVPLSNLEVRELEVSREILAIDFGTSNTTAGIYLSSENSKAFSQHDILNGNLKVNEINYVMFENVASEKKEWIELLPTVVGVEACRNPNEIKLQFGYEVVRHDNLTGGDDLSSTFYEIKRWVNNYKESVEISDHKGNVAFTNRGNIIRDYIMYVIKHAQQQFKCEFKHLHISSPVKLKKQFIDMFERILPNYEFEKRNALDEGVAVLYNTIENQINRGTYHDGMAHKALIIDCGGGTTDLSSCTFTIEEGRLNYEILVNTTYENGDTNFGGNNLTYRILQYLKILIAEAYLNNGEKIKLTEIIEVLSGDVFRYLDRHGKDALYKKLEERYERWETVIPTQYNRYLNKSNNEYVRVKANYHTLWRLASEIKQRFFENSDLIGINLSKVKLTSLVGFKLSVINSKGFDYLYKIPDVTVSEKEISRLIKGDIYYIIKKFLEDIYYQGDLETFSIIKMTGQSCRIELFRDSIKEFIPGREIEFRAQENHVLDLKLSCLNGVLKYLHAKKTARVRAQIENATPITPYSIYAYNYKDEKQILLTSAQSLRQVSGFISKDCEIKEMVFYLEDTEGVRQTSYLYHHEVNKCYKTSYEEIKEQYGDYILQKHVDDIEPNEVKFFVYGTNDAWGFNVLAVMRLGDGELRKSDVYYFPFENEQWELNFFDGEK